MTRFAFGGEVRQGQAAGAPRPAGSAAVLVEQRRQGGGADAGGRAAEEVAAGQSQAVVRTRVHVESLLGDRLVEVQQRGRPPWRRRPARPGRGRGSAATRRP